MVNHRAQVILCFKKCSGMSDETTFRTSSSLYDNKYNYSSVSDLTLNILTFNAHVNDLSVVVLI